MAKMAINYIISATILKIFLDRSWLPL